MGSDSRQKPQAYKKGPNTRRRPGTKPPGWNRKCRICGRDPWPNYIYCPNCFFQLNRAGHGLEELEAP